MLFPRIDTRAQLLAIGDVRGARIVEQVDINMATALSQRAVVFMTRAQTAMRTYRVEAARVLYCDAAAAAREDRDGFAEAAAVMLLTLLMDGIGPKEAQPASCAEAAELLDYDIFSRREELTEKRMERQFAVQIMEPRLELQELIALNRAEYDVRTKSIGSVDARKRTDALLIHRSGDAAVRVAEAGKNNAARTFGRDHWWCAVFEARRVMAMLIRDGKLTDEARKAAVAALNLFAEWSQDGDTTFAVDVEMMTQAAAGTLVIA